VQPEVPGQFNVSSFNVLSAAYADISIYPNLTAIELAPEVRYPQIRAIVAHMNSSIICLQEVDQTLYDQMKAEVEKAGYLSFFALKSGRKEGLLTLWKRNQFRKVKEERMELSHGPQIATFVGLQSLQPGKRLLQVANVHLLGDPTKEVETHQLQQVMEKLHQYRVASTTSQLEVVLCGDFNFLPDSPQYALVHGFGGLPSGAVTGATHLKT
jgi:mRNA deadenylase 3'-5' endonuclease subunit Ccr4